MLHQNYPPHTTHTTHRASPNLSIASLCIVQLSSSVKSLNAELDLAESGKKNRDCNRD